MGNHLNLACRSINTLSKDVFPSNHYSLWICREAASAFFEFWMLTYADLFYQFLIWSHLWKISQLSSEGENPTVQQNGTSFELFKSSTPQMFPGCTFDFFYHFPQSVSSGSQAASRPASSASHFLSHRPWRFSNLSNLPIIRHECYSVLSRSKFKGAFLWCSLANDAYRRRPHSALSVRSQPCPSFSIVPVLTFQAMYDCPQWVRCAPPYTGPNSFLIFIYCAN